MKKPLSLVAIAIATCAVLQTAHAGEPMKDKNVLEFDPYAAGSAEFQLGVGSFFSLNNGGDKRPSLDDADINLRLGWMLYTASGSGLFRGNLEFLGEVWGAGIYEGPGSVMAGGNLLLRYNFVQDGAHWVPYFQIGAGGLYNDVYKETPQRLIGQSFEFNLQAAAGVRYHFSNRCAAFLEGGYRHISNADNADRNLGLNSLGGLIGMSVFF